MWVKVVKVPRSPLLNTTLVSEILQEKKNLKRRKYVFMNTEQWYTSESFLPSTAVVGERLCFTGVCLSTGEEVYTPPQPDTRYQTPPPLDRHPNPPPHPPGRHPASHCSGQYASYWNAFLLKKFNFWENMFPGALYYQFMHWGLLLKLNDNDVTILSFQCYFLGVPEHWCKPTDDVFSNCTEDQVKALTIPIEYRDGQSVYSQCQIFKYNYTEQEIDGYCSGNSSSPKDMHPLAPVGCSQWDFDTSVYSHNIVTEVIQWHSIHKYFTRSSIN